MRIDAHQHFWRYDPIEYSWIGDGMRVLRRDFGPLELKPQLDALEMDACVAVQAHQSLEETRRLLEVANEHSFVRGVVGWADLRRGNVAGQLGEMARNPRLVGLRHIVQDEPDDGFLLRDDFCKGVGELAELDLTYDILVHPRHLEAAAQFVGRFPEQRFVLDHLAKPFIAKGLLLPWSTHVHALARHPNVYCKLSGMVTEADRGDWTPGDFVPYLDVALEAFGPERLMFGSDWPVCLLAAEYADVVDVVDRWAKRLNPGERTSLFGLNAVRFYGLE